MAADSNGAGALKWLAPQRPADGQSRPKSISSIHEPDIRFRNLADARGARPMSIDDLLAMVEHTQLLDAVPGEIRREFDAARDDFVDAWLAYEFTTIAELAGNTVLALRRRPGSA